MKKDNFSCLKQNHVESQSWSVDFEGEASIDAGGPYRESLTNIASEFMSNALPQLIKTPNNKNDHGMNRECWIPNSAAKNPTHLEVFKFMGALIGHGIRSQSPIVMDFPGFFWKQIINEKPDLEDLKGVDAYCTQTLIELQKQAKKLKDEEFAAGCDETFVTRISNGEEVELCKGGRDKKVTRDNVEEFINLIIEARINENKIQMDAIKEGIALIINVSSLAMLTWEEVERRATGEKIIDPAVLKKVTSYNVSETNEYVQRFWRVFEEFSEEDKRAYLKYTWGRSRMPSDTSSMQKQKIHICMDMTPESLPRSHTCFFQFDMPPYPTDEICHKKIMIAISFCGEIDDDGSYGATGDYGDEDDE